MTSLLMRNRRPSAAALAACERAGLAAERGDAAAAEAAYREALVLAPRLAEAHNNLGNVLMALGRFAEAVTSYREALACGLEVPPVRYNLATALRRNGEAAAASVQFAVALASAPEYAEAWNNLGNLFREAGDCGGAVVAYLRALLVRPDWHEAHDNLSGALYLLHDSGDSAAAAAGARRWLTAHPDNPMARHLGAALAGVGGDARAGDDYVRQVFDHFADAFDVKLAELEYRAPRLLTDALIAAVDRTGDLCVLDAGCGTGLCGPLLRGLAGRLVGVDLSPGMLEKARSRGVYDQLIEGELTEALATARGRYDAIVAADVLCYFGDLSPVLAAAAVALVSGGWLAFSVEQLEGTPVADACAPYRLLPHGRYAHDAAAVREQITAAGLVPVTLDRAVLRQESGRPVLGLVVVARRPVRG